MRTVDWKVVGIGLLIVEPDRLSRNIFLQFNYLRAKYSHPLCCWELLVPKDHFVILHDLLSKPCDFRAFGCGFADSFSIPFVRRKNNMPVTCFVIRFSFVQKTKSIDEETNKNTNWRLLHAILPWNSALLSFFFSHQRRLRATYYIPWCRPVAATSHHYLSVPGNRRILRLFFE